MESNTDKDKQEEDMKRMVVREIGYLPVEAENYHTDTKNELAKLEKEKT